MAFCGSSGTRSQLQYWYRMIEGTGRKKDQAEWLVWRGEHVSYTSELPRRRDRVNRQTPINQLPLSMIRSQISATLSSTPHQIRAQWPGAPFVRLQLTHLFPDPHREHTNLSHAHCASGASEIGFDTPSGIIDQVNLRQY